MMNVIQNWPNYIAEIFRVTAPGGHVQLCEISMSFLSPNAPLRPDSALKVIERALRKHAIISHHDPDIGMKLNHLVGSAGFHSVEEKVVEIPCGSWHSGAHSLTIPINLQTLG